MVGFELEPSCYYSTSDDVSTHAYLQPLSSLLGYALKKSFLLGFSVKILFLDKLSLIFVSGVKYEEMCRYKFYLVVLRLPSVIVLLH